MCSVSFYGPILLFLNNIKKQNHENVYSVQHLQVNIGGSVFLLVQCLFD